ncbi:glycoside hydrolase family 26 protein, partial [Bacteroidota bacterium]
MKAKNIFFLILTVFCLSAILSSCSNEQKAVTPNASTEAQALLDFIYSLSGEFTLTGQHNYPNTKDRNTQFAKEYIGQTPAVWSSDMGFAEDGDYDSYLARPDIVKEAIRQHKKGSIITLCWHAVPPTADEPVTFSPKRDGDPAKLETIQGQLLDEQFKDVLTPGTALHEKWCQQVDSVAVYLKKLQEAKVPVLWRPYHEMNGDWFWWGGRVGEYSTADLYRQMYDRYVNHHKLNNLVWVWNVDRPSTPIRKFSNFYPGTEYLDIVSLDVYGSDFNKDYYDSLYVLAKGKPMLFGEVGNPPMPEILDEQPNWTLWVIWAGFVRNLNKKQHQVLVNDRRILSMEDAAYHEATASYRKKMNLPLLPVEVEDDQPTIETEEDFCTGLMETEDMIYPTDFTGEWIFNEE